MLRYSFAKRIHCRKTARGWVTTAAAVERYLAARSVDTTSRRVTSTGPSKATIWSKRMRGRLCVFTSNVCGRNLETTPHTHVTFRMCAARGTDLSGREHSSVDYWATLKSSLPLSEIPVKLALEKILRREIFFSTFGRSIVVECSAIVMYSAISLRCYAIDTNP
jgi:hypothetical protein